MKLLTVSVGQPREVEWNGEAVRTSIWKQPIAGPVTVTRLNLMGDRQSDLAVHGGPDKAVYCYPAEHYEFWRVELGDDSLAHGGFGENLTTTGLDESTVRIGDKLCIGTVKFTVTQPRMPCFKLGIRFGRPDLPRRFMTSGRSGFYLSVAAEGVISAGDDIHHEPVPAKNLTVADIVSLYSVDTHNQELLRQAVELTQLPTFWRDYFRKRLTPGGSI